MTGRSQISGNSASHAFVGDANDLIDLGTLGGNDSYGFGINNSGQVTGRSQISGGEAHAFLWDPSDGLLDLNALVADLTGWISLTEARSISNSGHICRTAHDVGPVPCCWQPVENGSVITRLDPECRILCQSSM